MSGKILIILQFWEGDKALACKLARYLADLEPAHTSLADLMLLARYDSSNDSGVVQHVSRKFNVFSVKSWRRGFGWPTGCNDLWFSGMEWVYSMKEAKKVPDYKAIFTCEADGCPIPRDWIARLSSEWDRVNKDRPVVMAGALQEHGPHINGNALMSGDLKFLKWLTRIVGGCHPAAGWDFILAPEFQKQGWADIPGIKSLYNTPTFSQDDYKNMVSYGWIWVHGGKDDSLIRYGRERFKV